MCVCAVEQRAKSVLLSYINPAIIPSFAHVQILIVSYNATDIGVGFDYHSFAVIPFRIRFVAVSLIQSKKPILDLQTQYMN